MTPLNGSLVLTDYDTNMAHPPESLHCKVKPAFILQDFIFLNIQTMEYLLND
jgi:hypothetical protein